MYNKLQNISEQNLSLVVLSSNRQQEILSGGKRVDQQCMSIAVEEKNDVWQRRKLSKLANRIESESRCAVPLISST